MFRPIIFGSSKDNIITTWENGPDVRGTYEIITSCIITATICLSQAIHLHLPFQEIVDPHFDFPSQEARAWQVFRKVAWLIMGLLAPELEAFTAWYQHRETAFVYKGHCG